MLSESVCVCVVCVYVKCQDIGFFTMIVMILAKYRFRCLVLSVHVLYFTLLTKDTVVILTACCMSFSFQKLFLFVFAIKPLTVDPLHVPSGLQEFGTCRQLAKG